MVGCSAANSSEKGLRLFRFPQDTVRRMKWTINCRRDKWEPSSSARLCIVHFEESEFENKRADNWKKLKSNAVPTLFNVPNPPPQILSKRKKGIGLPKPGSILDAAEKIVSEHQDECESSRVNESESKEALEHEIILLRKEKEKLQRELSTTMSKCASFLSEEQIKNLGEKTQSIPSWSKESIIKGLKLRFALGKHGYEYLRSTGYPAPSYSTLNRRIQGIHVEFGVLHNIINLLKTKIDSMPANDKLCCISFDEMEIASVHDFDKKLLLFSLKLLLCKPGFLLYY